MQPVLAGLAAFVLSSAGLAFAQDMPQDRARPRRA